MKLVLTLIALWCFAAPGFAQAPIEPALPATSGCGDTLLISADSYDFTNARGGGSGAFDWIHCATPSLGYSFGASAHSVADSRWVLSHAGITLRPRPELIFYANANLGSGDSAAGNFDYFTSTVGVIAKTAERLYLKAEHQSFHIGITRGDLLRVTGIVTLFPAVTAEIGVARSIDGSLAIRSNSVRFDWDAGSARPFAGVAHGRQIPQAFEAAAGASTPTFTTREWFAGVTVPFKRCDWIVAFGAQRGEATSRRTITSALKFSFK